MSDTCSCNSVRYTSLKAINYIIMCCFKFRGNIFFEKICHFVEYIPYRKSFYYYL